VEQLEDRLTPAAVTPSQNFVSQAFLDLLGRQVDPSGLSTFSSQVDGGLSRNTVAQEIEHSPEFLAREINLLYGMALNRAADPTGLNVNLAALQTGSRLEQVLVGILSSPEFFQAHGSTNDGWLDGAYAVLQIGHPTGTVDPAGRIGWDQVFAMGTPRSQVASLLANGLQYERNVVTTFYSTLLHRAPDPTGLNSWVGFDQLFGQLAVEANLIGSPEYFGLAQGNPQTPFATVASFTPATGIVGSQVVIHGTFLNNVTALTIAGNSIPTNSFSIDSATQITATIPASAVAGTGPVSVSTPFGPATSASNFTIGPGITSFGPTSGPQGTTVNITGSNFTGATAVTIDGLSVSAGQFSVVDAQHITATAPTGGTAGTSGPVTVTTAFGTATSTSNFSLTAPGSPTFTPSPSSGQAGDVVTLNGTNLFGVTSVTFNGVTAAVVPGSNTSTQVQVTVPNSTNGNIVVNTTPGNTGSAFFSYPATVTGFGPGSVGQGSTVTINGTNLLGATGVVFTGTSTVATPFNVTNTSLQVVIPTGATTGTVQVTTGAGTFTSATSLTVVPPPSISSVPSTDNETALVKIFGSNLSGATQVTFQGTSVTFSVINAGEIDVNLVNLASVVSPFVGTGGSFSVTVTTVGGTSAPATYTLIADPDDLTGRSPSDTDDIV
jgi:hypothetical protein